MFVISIMIGGVIDVCHKDNGRWGGCCLSQTWW